MVASARRVWLLDASIYIFRAWFSMPDRWHTETGTPLNAVYGYAGFLGELYCRIPPGDILAAAFDESLGSCFRNDIYPDYKCRRELPDAALAFQLDTCRELTELAGIRCYGGPRYEADDYLASLARLARRDDCAITVITRDKDLGQLLVGEGDYWWDMAADRVVDRNGFVEQFGVLPQQFADYLALVGDSIDDIPGVPGIGPKTAASLLQACRDLDGIATQLETLAHLPVRGASRLPEKLRAYWPQIVMSRQLARLADQIGEVDDLPSFTAQGERAADVASRLESLGLFGPAARRWRTAAGESRV